MEAKKTRRRKPVPPEVRRNRFMQSLEVKDDEGPTGHEETLVVIQYRDRDDDAMVTVDSYLRNASAEPSLTEFTLVAKAEEHRIEECLQRAKSEAGLADYQCRQACPHCGAAMKIVRFSNAGGTSPNRGATWNGSYILSLQRPRAIPSGTHRSRELQLVLEERVPLRRSSEPDRRGFF